MATQGIDTVQPLQRDWGTAWAALKRLLADGNDTVQVFRIMRALNADTSHRNYHYFGRLEEPAGFLVDSRVSV